MEKKAVASALRRLKLREAKAKEQDNTVIYYSVYLDSFNLGNISRSHILYCVYIPLIWG